MSLPQNTENEVSVKKSDCCGSDVSGAQCINCGGYAFHETSKKTYEDLNPREIKFRCWDRASKSMKSSRYWMVMFDGTVIPSDRKGGYQAYEKDEGFNLMQYTGLKDKNGKEIYEGDIMDLPVAFLPDRKAVKVVWNKSGWFFDDGKSLHSFFGELIERGEVIGNIYENPELLETKTI